MSRVEVVKCKTSWYKLPEAATANESKKLDYETRISISFACVTTLSKLEQNRKNRVGIFGLSFTTLDDTQEVMPNTWITDLEHPPPPDVEVPKASRAIADYFFRIADEAIRLGVSIEEITSNVQCRLRSNQFHSKVRSSSEV